MRIGILGAVVNNNNMGCVAITYSLLTLLNHVEREMNEDFDYIIFEPNPNRARNQKMCQALDLNPDKYRFVACADFSRPHKLKRNINMFMAIRSCGVVIDMTQGDSFSDIYGAKRFKRWTTIKRVVEVLGRPLVLGPQTYGPFYQAKNRDVAKKAIEKAELVIARDKESADYVQSFCNKKVQVTTDVAFLLPFTKTDRNEGEGKIKIGLNISGLLSLFMPVTTERHFTLKCDYDALIRKLLGMVCENPRYQVYLFSHVQEDYDVSRAFVQEFPACITIPFVADPMDLKSHISAMDIFIGSRMHATIAAFSSGVATIPLAYSRKFRGMFESLGYPYTVDLQDMELDEILEKIQNYIANRQDLLNAAESSRKIIGERLDHTYQLLKGAIQNHL